MSATPRVTLPVHGKSGTGSDGFWDMPLNDLLQQLQATPIGLTSVEAKRRLGLYGPNTLERESRFAVLLSLARFFANPLILILMAASAISPTAGDGMGSAVIVSTGKNTELEEIASRLAAKPPETEFGRGIRNFGMMITRVIMLLVLFVLLVNIILHRPLLESFLFSVALAVWMTPELMPMIITITLAQGARRMANKRVLVKQLAAIEDFGSLTILCSDKTGTLTEGEIVLDRHVDVTGAEDDSVLRFVYINRFFQAGIKSPMDDAGLKFQLRQHVQHVPGCDLPLAGAGRQKLVLSFYRRPALL